MNLLPKWRIWLMAAACSRWGKIDGGFRYYGCGCRACRLNVTSTKNYANTMASLVYRHVSTLCEN
jgi:hypothetical protein